MRRTTILIAALALVAGCGSKTDQSAQRAPSPTATGTRAAVAAALGVDTVDWPNDVTAATKLLTALPATVAGRKKHSGTGSDGGWADYGDEQTAVMVRPVEPKRDAPGSLAELASFLMCDPSSLVGTAPVEGLATSTDANDVWFSCTVARNADSGMPGAHVLGWTSGDVVWFVNAVDSATLAALVSPMVKAAAALPGDGQGTLPAATTEKVPYGIEDVAWPQTLEAAQPLELGLPALDGEEPQVGMPEGSMTADYESGDGVTVVTAGSEGVGVAGNLGAAFGLVYGCAPGTFHGTAAIGIEGARPQRAEAGAKVRWFTCEVDGAEGDEDFRGFAVGWTAGKTGWLVIGSSKERAETLVTALVSQAGR